MPLPAKPPQPENTAPEARVPAGVAGSGDDMASYTIGDAEQLLRVKAHVIRYWEKEVPLVQPAKDTYGRRIYTGRDLQLFCRLKYLLYERRFTLEGAKAQLYRELAGNTRTFAAAFRPSARNSSIFSFTSAVTARRGRIWPERIPERAIPAVVP